ncbi:MAG: hypothetical protein K2X47_12670 [Bdellovibrionales bacterium]|nr:hypothetical protein [Bdellovibrionales bacterium]
MGYRLTSLFLLLYASIGLAVTSVCPGMATGDQTDGYVIFFTDRSGVKRATVDIQAGTKPTGTVKTQHLEPNPHSRTNLKNSVSMRGVLADGYLSVSHRNGRVESKFNRVNDFGLRNDFFVVRTGNFLELYSQQTRFARIAISAEDDFDVSNNFLIIRSKDRNTKSQELQIYRLDRLSTGHALSHIRKAYVIPGSKTAVSDTFVGYFSEGNLVVLNTSGQVFQTGTGETDTLELSNQSLVYKVGNRFVFQDLKSSAGRFPKPMEIVSRGQVHAITNQILFLSDGNTLFAYQFGQPGVSIYGSRDIIAIKGNLIFSRSQSGVEVGLINNGTVQSLRDRIPTDGDPEDFEVFQRE